MDLNLSGQNVAVFGAAQGIGRAIAEQFEAEGCSVVGFDQSPDSPALKNTGEVTVGDVTSFEQVSAFADAHSETDHVVFSVGVGSGKFGFPFWNLDPSDWARVLEVNLVGGGQCRPCLRPPSHSKWPRVTAVSGFGRRSDGFPNRPTLQRSESRPDQLHASGRKRLRSI